MLLTPGVASICYNVLMLAVNLLVLRWLARRWAVTPLGSSTPNSRLDHTNAAQPIAVWKLCLRAVLRLALAGMILALFFGGSAFGAVRLLAYGVFLHGTLLLLGLAALLWRLADVQAAAASNSTADDPPADLAGPDYPADPPADPAGPDYPADPPAENSSTTEAPGESTGASNAPRASRRFRWFAIACLAAAIGLVAAAVDAFLIEPKWLELTRIEITSPKLARRYRIVLITDLQVDRVTQYERRALLLAQQQQPDLILLGGDYTQVAWQEFEAVASQLHNLLREVDLRAPLGVFAVRGNVDVFDWQQLFAGLPITAVSHTRSFDLDGLRLTCLGLHDSYQTGLHLTNPTPQRFHIVLGHSPNFALGNIDADLLLAGHTHGGQVRLPLLGTIFPNAAVPRSWAAGLTQLPSGAKLYVSRGVGMERGDSPRMRFMCRPELTVIDLVPSFEGADDHQQNHAQHNQAHQYDTQPGQTGQHHTQQNHAGQHNTEDHRSPHSRNSLSPQVDAVASAQNSAATIATPPIVAVARSASAPGPRPPDAQAGSKQPKSADDELPEKFARLIPLHKRLGKPQPGEWLWHHPEPGQTYRQYVESRPVRPTPKRRTIYVQPLGEFTPAQQRIVDLTAEFIGIYFDLPVRKLKPLPLDVVPARARRVHPAWGDHQVLTGYVLYEVLKPRMPDDACAMIGLTSADLWPGEGWNFVFGEASLRDRVGVWSLYRNGEPEKGEAEFRLCLLRTIKTAAHELGHMFSMAHCTAFECLMCGSNHRAEADRRPLALCPHCLAKLCYATGADPEKRYERLIDFCRRQGLKPQQEFYEKLLAALRQSSD